MTEKESTPEYRERVLQEHESLRRLLRELHETLTARAEQTHLVAEKMTELAAHLKTHFEEEEEGGFFTQVVARAPRFADDVGQLSEEHKSMTEAVEALRKLAANGNGSAAWWEQIDADFHRLSKELMQHENHENQILQDAYTEDIGSGD